MARDNIDLESVVSDPAQAHRLRTALIGAGAAARILYKPIMGGTGIIRWTHIVDPSPQGLEVFQHVAGLKRFTGTASQFFESDDADELDAVVVALPHHLHEECVLQALKKGLHVFCEKPLGLTAKSVERMMDASTESGRGIAVCQPRREYPAFQAIREVLRQGWLGEIQRVDWSEGQLYGWPAATIAQISAEHGGEELYDIGAHAFDLLSVLFGQLAVTGYRDDSEGGAGAEFDIELTSSGCSEIRVSLSRLRSLRNTLQIQGTGGCVEWDVKNPLAFDVNCDQMPGPLKQCRIQLPAEKWNGFERAIDTQLEQFGHLSQGKSASVATAGDALAYARLFDQCRARQVRSSRGIKVSSTTRSAVTGASGFIGERLVALLQADGQHVTALASRAQSCVLLARRCVDIRLADILSPAALDTAIPEGTEVLYHCAVGRGTDEKVHRNIVEGTLNVLKAARQRNVKKVIVFSSMMAIGDLPSTGVVDEMSPARSVSPGYAMAKQKMESVVRSFAAEHRDLQIAVLRPACVYGPRGQAFVDAPLRQMLQHRFFLMNNGQGTSNLIYVDNLAEAAKRLAAAQFASGDIFFVNEEEWAAPWSDYFQQLATMVWGEQAPDYPSFSSGQLHQEIQRRQKKQNFPQVLRDSIRSHPASRDWLNRQFWFRTIQRMKSVGSRSRQQPVLRESKRLIGQPINSRKELNLQDETLYLNSSMVDFYTSQAVVSSQKLRNAIGWSPRIPRPEGLQRTADWARRQLEFFRP